MPFTFGQAMFYSSGWKSESRNLTAEPLPSSRQEEACFLFCFILFWFQLGWGGHCCLLAVQNIICRSCLDINPETYNIGLNLKNNKDEKWKIKRDISGPSHRSFASYVDRGEKKTGFKSIYKHSISFSLRKKNPSQFEDQENESS